MTTRTEADACPGCGAAPTLNILPTTEGPLAVSVMCASCHDKTWRQFVWIKTWGTRFESWGAPKAVIAAWWAFWTECDPPGWIVMWGAQ